MRYAVLVVVLMWTVMSCGPKRDAKFRFVPGSESGVTFRNRIQEAVEFNIFKYMYFYNGAGVAVGDVNGDGLLDLYFTSNQEDNKLYLNKGGMKFTDATEVAGVAGFNGWATGVSMADVNNDGRLDIYVGYIGDYEIYKGKNQLFINEGNNPDGTPIFKDRAIEYGLDLVGFATQAAFLDYDKDGDLDMYMLNHSIHQNGTFGPSSLRNVDHELSGDRLLRNDNGRFIEVTREAGIYKSVIGYGLGVVVADVNLDGWPDVYVGNDFHENDYLYINQQNGTFKEQLESQMMHTSRYTMGVDFADFNNDLYPDLIASDMLPSDPVILKASQAEEPYDIFDYKLTYGYNYQYARNVLQLNQGDGKFSEIGLYAGVHASDWSWSALFADFDLDGNKDAFISNGILRRSNDMDYINFVTVDSIQARLQFQIDEKVLGIVKKMPQVKIPNAMYRSNGDSTFTNMAVSWGLDKPSYSHGTAYADLDNDGDLDLVTNNVEDEAFVIENLFVQASNKSNPHFLRVVLEGSDGNRFGWGTKVILYQGRRKQVQECSPVRGYQSSVDYRLTFGLGDTAAIDSIVVIWPDDRFQVLRNVAGDQELKLAASASTGKYDYSVYHNARPLLQEWATAAGLGYKHRENKFVEFTREPLLPHMLSAEGPGVAVGDVNGDNLEDVFIGGGKWQADALYVQTKEGSFKRTVQAAIERDSVNEDVDAVFVDVDKDGDQDLVVASGGNEFNDSSSYMQPHLYLNDGKGKFETAIGALPDMFLTASSVSTADINKDGSPDLVITARTIPYRYGVAPRNFLLINDGKGVFRDETALRAPALMEFGFIKQSSWGDVDGDGDEDLLLAAEWRPVTIMVNTDGKFAPVELGERGWWNTVLAFDADQDGDLDLMAGNLGLNSKVRASQKEPIRLYVNDFDKNGTSEQILSHYLGGKEYPFYTHDELVKQMPSLKKKYLSYQKFAEANLQDMFDKKILESSTIYQAEQLASVYFENKGGLKFEMRMLPAAVQFSTANTFLADDFNKDGKMDVLVGGNFYPNNIQMGRYDSSYGLLLLGNGKGGWTAMPETSSGFVVSGEIRELRKLVIKGEVRYVAFRNNAKPVMFGLR